MWQIFIIIGILLCGFQVIQTRNLTHAAMWLAMTSALVSWLIYVLGAYILAVIELSVGAGVVTILLVFAINIVGDIHQVQKPFIPAPLSIFIILSAIVMISGLLLPADNALNQFAAQSDTLSISLWENRYLDTMLQMILIFTSVLGVLSLMEKRETRFEAKEPEKEGTK